jgi:type II secretory pathway component PulL
MPEKILGLDINSDSVAAVQVAWGLKGHQVTACDHVMTEEAGGLEEAVKALVERVGPVTEVCFSALPAEHVSFRNLRMPFRDKKKIRQTLVFELETIVPFPVEDLLVDFTIVDQSDQSEILAASVKRAYVSEHLENLQANGINPEVLDISGMPTLSWLLRKAETPDDGLLLQMGRQRNTMVLYLNRRIALVRSFSLNGVITLQAASNETNNGDVETKADEEIESCLRSLCTEVQNTLHAFEWENRRTVRPEKIFVTGIGTLYPHTEDCLNRFFELPVEKVDLSSDPGIHMNEDVARVWNPALMDNALALAMRKTKEDLGFNFRRDEFEVRKEYFGHKREIRKVAAFLIIILCLLGLDLGTDYYFLQQRYQILDERITEVFKETFPDAKRIVDPVHQMKISINEMKKTASSLPGTGANTQVLDLLRDISLRVQEAADVHVSRMVVDADTVLMKGETDTFNTVDAIKKGLEPSDYFSAVTISSANLDRSGKRVNFEIKLQRTQ